ncbi:MAG: hypothetical protein GXZ04_01310 [Clostridiales bacterium]|nr:hypothetical protein [Clostridiales bacterium]
MRAKLLFLAEKPEYQEGMRLAQEMLSELAVAFSHSFLMREKLLDGEPAQQELLEMAGDHDAVVLFGSESFADQFAAEMSCFAGMIQAKRPETISELSRLKEGNIPAVDFIWPISDQSAVISKTAVTACAHAKKRGQNIVLSHNDVTKDWETAVNRAAMYAALPSPFILPLHDVMNTVLFQPEHPFVVLACADEKSLLNSLLCFMSGTELLQHTCYVSDQLRLHAVVPPVSQQGVPLFSALYAAAGAIRESLSLEQEADCLETAIDNVLASGWRTPEFGMWPKTISHEEALRLVVEQVHLAGELMEKLH